MSLLNLQTRNEQPASMQQVIPSDSRNFSRSDRGWSVPGTRDSNLAEDESGDIFHNWVVSIQKFMSISPFAPRYTGSLNGKIDSTLLASLQSFEKGIEKLTGESVNIVSGGIIDPSGIRQAQKAFQKYQKEQLSKKKDTSTDVDVVEPNIIQDSSLVKAYQSYLSQPLPLVGKTYSGPVDGQINDNLIAAAKQVESTISSFINKGVSGVIWNDGSKKFNTTPADIKEALNLIVEHKNNQKVSNDSSKDRILTFSTFLLRKSKKV